MRPKLADLRMSPERRFETGCIATMTDGERIVTQHFTGNGSEATRAVAAFCDRHGFHIVTLSTPTTIYRDLQGHRQEDESRAQYRVAATGSRPDILRTPERHMLGRIHRMDLLA